jgi:hypothetical protein
MAKLTDAGNGCIKCGKINNTKEAYESLRAWNREHGHDTTMDYVTHAVLKGKMYSRRYSTDSYCQGCSQMMVFTGEMLGLLLAKLGVRIKKEL